MTTKERKTTTPDMTYDPPAKVRPQMQLGVDDGTYEIPIFSSLEYQVRRRKLRILNCSVRV